MAKYFVRIGEEQRGPYSLEELPDVGVTPDTYVWCKGMKDWEKASQDADICRFYRQRLSGIQKTEEKEEPSPVKGTRFIKIDSETPMNLRDVIREANRMYEEQAEAERNRRKSQPPRMSAGLAVAAMLFCFPPTGIVAVYYSMRARKMWKEGVEANDDDIKLMAHDVARTANMWTGITFFMGVILWAAIARYSDSL